MPSVAAALGPTITSGSDSAVLSDLDLPNALLPVIGDICMPLIQQSVAAPNSTQDSFLVSTENAQGPSGGGFNTTLATLGSGPWRLKCVMTSIADFNAPPGTPLTCKLALLNPAAVANYLAKVLFSTTPQTVIYDFALMLPTNGWKVQAVADATGAAQNQYGFWSVYGARPL